MVKILFQATDAFLNIQSILDKFAENGDLETVIYLTEKGAKCSTNAMNCAAGKGHFDMVKYLHFNRTEGCTYLAMDEASYCNHFEILQWLHFNRIEGCAHRAMDVAAENGNLDMVKWLHDNRTEGCTTIAMCHAGMNGYLDVVKWLHLNRTEGTGYGLVFATEACEFEVVKYLVENNLGLDYLDDAVDADIMESFENDQDKLRVFDEIHKYLVAFQYMFDKFDEIEAMDMLFNERDDI